MGNSTLKPCPFCNETHATLLQDFFGWLRVACASCGTHSGPYATKEEAMEAWNFRLLRDEAGLHKHVFSLLYRRPSPWTQDECCFVADAITKAVKDRL